MTTKREISTALNALTSAAMARCATADFPLLLGLHEEVAVALRDFSVPQPPTAITPAAVSPFADPFAPTFEVTPSAGGYTATIAMREGSVVYLVNATGPRSNAVKVSAAGLLPVLVAPLIEIPQ